MSTEIMEANHGKSWKAYEGEESPSQCNSADLGPRNESVWRTIRRYIWDDPDKPAAEKKLLLKLDFFLLTYTCLAYFCKNLDQANLSNAYVSGLQKAIGMVGNDLTYAGNVFTAGYVISQIPAVILVTKVRPSYLISTLEILWSVFTFCSATVKTVPQLYAIRFLVGLCEGAFFPTIVYLISSWYTRSERAKRVTLFYSTASFVSGIPRLEHRPTSSQRKKRNPPSKKSLIAPGFEESSNTYQAPMFSGYLQAGAYNGLNGKLGREGWQWLFIVCGIISLPVGVVGYFFNPDFPENTRAFYLTKEETVLAQKRLVDDGYKPLGASAWDKKKIFRIFSSWQFWVLGVSYFFVQSSCPTQQPFFSLYLKATGHSVYQRNVWPTGQYAVGVVTQIAAGMLSDSPLLRGRRWQAIFVMQSGTIFASIVLAIWNVPLALKYFAYYLSYTSAGVPGLYYSWFPDLMPNDHELRGFMTAFSNMYVRLVF